MVVAEIKTAKGTFHVVAEDESDARDKARDFFKKRFFSESVFIDSVTILSCSNKIDSNTTLIL